MAIKQINLAKIQIMLILFLFLINHVSAEMNTENGIIDNSQKGFFGSIIDFFRNLFSLFPEQIDGEIESTVITPIPTSTNIIQTSSFRSVGATAKGVGCDLIVTYHGGPDANLLNSLSIEVISPSGVSSNQVVNSPSVGQSLTFSGCSEPGKYTITVTGSFEDGTQQLILNQQVEISATTVGTPTSTQQIDTKSVGATAKGVGCDLIVTYHGGPDANLLNSLSIEVISPSGVSSNQVVNSPSVGQSLTFSGCSESGEYTITVTGSFEDGTQQMILNQQIGILAPNPSPIPTSTPFWDGKVKQVSFVDPSKYNIEIEECEQSLEPLLPSSSDYEMVTYANVQGRWSGFTEIIDLPFPYWEMHYTVKENAKPDYVFPSINIKVMNADNPNRCVRMIDPGILNPIDWEENDPRPWVERFYEGSGKYFIVITTRNLESYSIEIKVPK